MADFAPRKTLVRMPPVQTGAAGDGFALQSEPFLGVTSVRVLATDPDSWFLETLGIAAPAPCSEIEAGPIACAWLAPGEWLMTGAEDKVMLVANRCVDAAGEAALVTDLSHGRASFLLSGPASRDALAAHCPLDLSDRALPVGSAVRSVFGETRFFLSRKPDRAYAPVFRLIFDQTMAPYALRMFGGSRQRQA